MAVVAMAAAAKVAAMAAAVMAAVLGLSSRRLMSSRGRRQPI